VIQYISALPSLAWSEARVRRVVLLGSTGSIGRSALDVIARYPERFQVTALAGGRNAALLAEQAVRWRPEALAVQDEASARELRELLPARARPEILIGQEGYVALASLPEADTVLSALVGAAGLRSTLAAVNAGKVACVANKESLVLAGRLIRRECARTGAVILPVDSEHNAVFQAMLGRPALIKRIVLTASGGPFRGWKRDRLTTVTAAQALKHPNWSMGAKITIDSATLMNKGLEVLEAHALYDLPSERIGVVVHPQSIVHALVEMEDGSSLAQMGAPDMRIPIAQCLNWPHCADVGAPAMDLAALGSLTFEEPDVQSFPCLELARRALREGGDQAVALNAANEEAVSAFLSGTTGFMDIPALIERAMDACSGDEPEHLDAVLQRDAATRRMVRAWLQA
jgi:1-deoxy-D-xylulose-5-phosphate reductoisomerase